jgi:PAS domain S-box-containing protein
MVSFKLTLGALFTLLVGAVTVLAIVSFQSSKLSIQTAILVKDSHEVLEMTNEISALCRDIQLESNAFSISKDSVVLNTYLAASRAVFPLIASLKNLTVDNTAPQQRIDTLKLIVHELITFTDSVWNTADLRPAENILRRIHTNNGFRNRIRDLIRDIKADEKLSLENHEEANIRSVNAFNTTFVWLIGCIAVLLPSTFFSIRYNFNRRIKIQDELKNVNELFVKLFYESPVGMVISRIQTGEIINCNKAFADLINFSKSELIGKTAVQLDILSNTIQREEIMSGVKRSGTARDLEVQLKPRDRESVWVSISMQSIDINDEPCLLSAILDMTVHKEAEEKMRLALNYEIELNKLKSNFVTLASHEFRTPLTTILSSAFLLDKYVSEEYREKVNKHLTRIKNSVSLLTSILDEFLSLSKIEEGKLEAKSEKLNIREAMDALCSNLQGMAKPGQRIVYAHMGEEEIYSDPVLLGSIVNNLVSNAIKYSADSDQIHVSSVVNSKIYLSVKDHGIGISKEDQKHLFDRFFRASNTGNIQGTGLGLHIMKHYLDMLGGSIEVISEPGQGSEFKISFDHILPDRK